MPKSFYKSDALLRLIERRIREGYYERTPFPSERKLAQETGLSVTCARQAVSTAIERKLLVRNGTGRLVVVGSARRDAPTLHVAHLSPIVPSYAVFLWNAAIRTVVQRRKGTMRVFHFTDGDDPELLKALGHPYNVFFITPPKEISHLLASRLKQASGKVISLFNDLSAHDVSMVDNSPLIGMTVLLDHLKRLGHRNIDCVLCQPRDTTLDARIKVWEDFLEKHRFKGVLHDTNVVNMDSISRRVIVYMRGVMANRNFSATAVVCLTITSGAAVIRAAYEIGRAVPEALSVAAFGPSVDGEVTTPALTSLLEPTAEEMVERAIDWAIQHSRSKKPISIVPEAVQLFEGESCGPPCR